MKIDITKITNPIVRRALQERARDFMFNYGDDSHSDVSGEHTEIHLFPRETYGGHSESDDDRDRNARGFTYSEARHTDGYTGDSYSERSSHTDTTKKSRGHTDYTDKYSEWRY